jgi:hypothetical protein
MSKLNAALVAVQSELKAPKGQFNKFGNYNYRSAEDILEAVKPLLSKNGLSMTISDEVRELAGILFIESRVQVTDGSAVAEVCAQAGIDPNRKGMDIAQCFGASSSYARKYALNGMFLIDDTKDADATNTHGKKTASPAAKDGEWFTKAVDYIKNSKDKKQAFDMVLSKYKDAASTKQVEALQKFVR